MKLDTLIDALSAFRSSLGNIEVTVTNPTISLGENGEIAWTEDFLPGKIGAVYRNPETGTEDPVTVIAMFPFPDLLAFSAEERNNTFNPQA